jgi:hypothetical protein
LWRKLKLEHIDGVARPRSATNARALFGTRHAEPARPSAAIGAFWPRCASTDTGRILVTVLGMVAEMERRFILERQRAGIDAAKKKGVYKGRKPSVPVDTVRQMRAKGHGPTHIADALGISKMSLWRALNAA